MQTVEVRTQLGEHRSAWDDLVAARRPAPADQLSWMLDNFATPRTRYVLVTADDGLVGGIAFDVARRGGVTTFRLVGDDFAPVEWDVLARPGREEDVREHVAGWLRAHRNARIDLAGMRAGSLLKTGLASKAVETELTGSPYLELGTDLQALLVQRSSKFRADIRRTLRRLHDEGCRHRRLRADEVDLGVATLERLHANRFTHDSALVTHLPRFRDVAHRGVRAEQLVFHVLECEGRVVAIKVNAEVGDHVVGYLSGMVAREERRFDGAGKALLALIIEDACARGMREFDLGPDPSPEKARWTDAIRPVVRLHGTWGWLPTAHHGIGACRAQAARVKRRVRGMRPDHQPAGSA